MSANPLEDDPERERRIRERAYHLWIAEGRPHGHDSDFWERARELVGMEESAGAGQLANPLVTGEDPTRGEPIEEAFIQENLGEFPDRLSDQGETATVPKPRGKAPAVDPEPIAETRRDPETLPANPSLKAKAMKKEAPAKAAEIVPTGKAAPKAAKASTGKPAPKASKAAPKS